MDQLKVVNLPRKVSIWAGNADEIILGVGGVDAPQRVVTKIVPRRWLSTNS